MFQNVDLHFYSHTMNNISIISVWKIWKRGYEKLYTWQGEKHRFRTRSKTSLFSPRHVIQYCMLISFTVFVCFKFLPPSYKLYSITISDTSGEDYRFSGNIYNGYPLGLARQKKIHIDASDEEKRCGEHEWKRKWVSEWYRSEAFAQAGLPRMKASECSTKFYASGRKMSEREREREKGS